jgi:four helix bundle protein
MPFAFEKLQGYQKAISFADEICTLTCDLPRGYFFLADQLNRAALSIAANIAEGNGRFTKADRRNFFGIARGSVQECVPLLELAARQKLLVPDRHQQLKSDLEETARMLSGLINGLERRHAQHPVDSPAMAQSARWLLGACAACCRPKPRRRRARLTL